MTIKISQLGNVAAVQGNVLLPIVSNITGTPTTVKANVDQLQTYILGNAGNIIPLASNTYSLGNSTTWWKDLWISNTTIYIGGAPLSTSGGRLTFAGANVGTTGLDTYTGNVSSKAVSLSGAIGPVSNVQVTNGGQGFSAGFTWWTGINQVNGAICSFYVTAVSDPPNRSIQSVIINNPGNAFHVGDAVTIVNDMTPNPGNGYPVSNATVIVTELIGAPTPAIYVGDTAWSFSAGGDLTTPGNVVLPDSTAIYNEDATTAVFTSNIITDTTSFSLTDGGNATVYAGEGTWAFGSDGTTTFPGDTTFDTAGNISAGNISVYGVESDTLSLTLSNSTSDVLPSYDGGIVLSTGTISTNLSTQYWGFIATGVTWFTVADDTNIQAGMQIYWAGRIIGTVTNVSSGNISCTPLTNVTPNFVNGSQVGFGNPAPLYTDEVTTNSGNLTITGNVSIEGNVTNTENVTIGGNVTVLSWLKGPAAGNISIGTPVVHNSNVTVLSWLNGSPTANLNIGSGSGQAVKISTNAGAKSWTFNSNGSVTFPDNTLQSTAGTYSNIQVSTYLPTYSGNIGGLLVTNPMVVFGNITAGFAFPTATFANVIFTGGGFANGYAQLNIQNVDSVGTQNSADFIATAPNGTDTSNYIDMGINGNNYSSSSWTVSGKNDGYVYINGGNLTLGTDTQGTTVKVHIGGTLAANVVTTFSNSNVTIGGNLIVSNSYVPTANNSPGSKGQISYDNSYVYVCIAANTWRRANLAIW